ncbi:dockerin type I domain-containing protein [Tundrisphaera lichenicola]|uniref:dockerin type I domain-containing protein n=1 Tax=Tundrisphaera lichenicola TaxID=2029860 RepID=UPI003EBB8AA0
MMTGGVGSTFAIMPATITKAGGVAKITFNLDPKLFTDPGNKPFVLGIDVAPNQGSAANPVVRSVMNPQGKNLSVSHAAFDPKVTRTGASADSKLSSAALVTIPGLPSSKATAATAKGGKAKAASAAPYTYTVKVAGLGKATGSILVGFYLPGNASGSGVVQQADINAIKYGLNTTANDTTGKYSFDADVDRNGKIDNKDLKIARKNLGVGTTVSPVISANLDPTGVVDINKRITNQPVATVTGVATPNSVISYSQPYMVPATSVADAAGNYSVAVNLAPGANTFNVTSTDAFNQKITGSIASITYNVPS